MSSTWPRDSEMMDVTIGQSSTGETAPVPSSPFYSIPFLGASQTFGKGETFLDIFNKDNYADKRNDNLYYPFATQPEWELASFLLKSGLSMAQTDEFLRLDLVSLKYCLKTTLNAVPQIKRIGLSFQTAKDLRNRAEILPVYKPEVDSNPDIQWTHGQEGLRWLSNRINTDVPTKKDLILYH